MYSEYSISKNHAQGLCTAADSASVIVILDVAVVIAAVSHDLRKDHIVYYSPPVNSNIILQQPASICKEHCSAAGSGTVLTALPRKSLRAHIRLIPQSLRLRKSTTPLSATGSGAVLFHVFFLAGGWGL